MKNNQNSLSCLETGGEIQTNSGLLANLQKLRAVPQDQRSAELVFARLEAMARRRAATMTWPSPTMREDVIQIVLQEVMLKTIHFDDTLAGLLSQQASHSLVSGYLGSLVGQRLLGRLIDQVRAKNRQSTVSLESYHEEVSQESEAPRLPDSDAVEKALRTRGQDAHSPDREIVAQIIASGESSIRAGAGKVGISRGRALRAINRIRPELRKDFEIE